MQNSLRLRHRGRIQSDPAPGDIQGKPGKIDHGTVPAIGTEVERSSHEDTIDRARLDAQRAEHALGVVDREVGDLKTFPLLDTLLTNIDTVDRAGLGTLVARDTGGQVEAMKPSIPCRYLRGPFRILKLLRKCLAIGMVSRE